MATPKTISYHGHTYVLAAAQSPHRRCPKGQHWSAKEQKCLPFTALHKHIMRQLKKAPTSADDLAWSAPTADPKTHKEILPRHVDRALRELKHSGHVQLDKSGDDLKWKLAAVTLGPRGGKIIGKTKSGKPIYEPSEQLHKVFTKDEIAGDPWGTVDHLGPPGTTKQVLAQHPDYTLQDHYDAAQHYEQTAATLLNGTDPYNPAHRAQRAKAHAHALLSRIHYYASQRRAPAHPPGH